MIYTTIIGAASAYGTPWAIGRAIADPRMIVTVAVAIGLVTGNVLGILKAKGRI